jgi:broad specificity phosphatase PhoE
MAYLHIVRHAQPDFAGHYDSITPLGRSQSSWLGLHYAALGQRFARIVSGGLQRHRQTVEHLAAELESPPTAGVDPRLDEYDAAALLGRFGPADAETLRARGDRQGYYQGVREALRAWSRHDGPLEAGEHWADFGRRAQAAIADAAADLPADAHVLVVTSGGIIGRLVADVLEAGAEAAIQLNLQVRNTGVTELVVGRRASRLVAFNSVPHLQNRERLHALTHS